MRKAISARSDVTVLDRARTTANLSAMRELGVDCAIDDVPCLAKVAVLLEVERIAVVVARWDGPRGVVRLTFIDPAGTGSSAEQPFEGNLDAAAAGQLVEAALGAAPGPLADEKQTPAETAARPPPALTAPTTLPAPLPRGPGPLRIAGLVAVGAGALAGAVGVVGALVVDDQLSTPEDYDERTGKLFVGQALATTAAAGVAVVVVGAALLLVDAVVE